MSYLHAPRIVFSGDFQADVSTINNDVRHYDTANFKKSFQEYGVGAKNGWWNPNGGSSFRFVNCRVQAGERLDGSVVSSAADDPVIGQLVGGPDDKPAGKMVDMDPQMQMCSQLIALELRLFTPDSELLLQGRLAATGFRDLGQRQIAGIGVNAQPMGALWTSVLTDLKWGEKAHESPLLSELKHAASSGMLSVNLAGFGFYYTHAEDGRFSMGRIVGSIGTWNEGEPKLFAPTRRLYSNYWLKNAAPPGNPPQYPSLFTQSNFQLVDDRKQLTLDLGNSIPLNDALGTIPVQFSEFKVVVANSKRTDRAPQDKVQTISSSEYEPIGDMRIADHKNWILKTGGIISFAVSAAAQKLLVDHQVLLLWLTQGREVIVGQESENGIMAKPDQTIQRLNPGQSKVVDFYAYQWGKPLAGTKFQLGRSNLSKQSPVDPPDFPKTRIPATGVPKSALSFLPTITTNSYGKAQVKISGSDPGNQRGYIDGQIYAIDFSLADGQPLSGYSMDWINVLVFDHFDIPTAPTWQDVGPIWVQFGNLYPVMSKHVVKMNNPEDILKRKDLLMFAFSLPETDSMYMPVTRDMSANKRATLIKWLENPPLDDSTAQVALKAPEYSHQTIDEIDELVDAKKAYEMQALTRAKGGAMDGLSMPDYSPDDIEFDD